MGHLVMVCSLDRYHDGSQSGNAEFIAHAREDLPQIAGQDVPALLELVKELWDKAERLRHRCDLYELAWARLSMHERVELQRQHNADAAAKGGDDGLD